MGGRGSGSGISKTYTHEQHVSALKTWTQGDYNSLKHSSVLEDFIRQSEPSRVQSLNRGVSMTQVQAESIKVGDSVSFDGLSSWPSRVGIAQSFARENASDAKPMQVTYRLKGGTNKAAKVGRLGGLNRYDEGEHIMSSTAKFKVDRIKRVDRYRMEVWVKE